MPVSSFLDMLAEGERLIRPGTNAGRSVVVKPHPLTVTTPLSRSIVPAKVDDPVFQATILNLTGDDEVSEVISVTLVNPNPFLVPQREPGPLPPAGGILARPSALLEWGVAGVQAQAEVDFKHGFSFSVPASFIRITAQNDRLNVLGPGGDPNYGRNVYLGAFGSYGTVSRNTGFNGTRTIYYDANPGPALTPIPNYATNFEFYRFPDVVGATILVIDEGGRTLFATTFPAGTTGQFPIELPADAAFISAGLSPWTQARLIFGLSI